MYSSWYSLMHDGSQAMVNDEHGNSAEAFIDGGGDFRVGSA